MALHNYIYSKHQEDVSVDKKIARDHDPRPMSVKLFHHDDEHHQHNDEDYVIHNTNNLIINHGDSIVSIHSPTSSDDVKFTYEEELAQEGLLEDEDESSDGDPQRIRNIMQQQKHHHHHHHHHHHQHHQHDYELCIHDHDHLDTQKISDSEESLIHNTNIANINTQIETAMETESKIPTILNMAINPSTRIQSSNLINISSKMEKASFKGKKWVIVDGKKRKLKSRFNSKKLNQNNEND